MRFHFQFRGCRLRLGLTSQHAENGAKILTTLRHSVCWQAASSGHCKKWRVAEDGRTLPWDYDPHDPQNFSDDVMNATIYTQPCKPGAIEAFFDPSKSKPAFPRAAPVNHKPTGSSKWCEDPQPGTRHQVCWQEGGNGMCKKWRVDENGRTLPWDYDPYDKEDFSDFVVNATIYTLACPVKAEEAYIDLRK